MGMLLWGQLDIQYIKTDIQLPSFQKGEKSSLIYAAIKSTIKNIPLQYFVQYLGIK
jgi:hypothetical protein